MIAPAMPSVASTMIGGSTFGRMWRSMMDGSRAPETRAAVTYSVSRVESTVLRTTRVYSGIVAMPTASMRLKRLVPRMATSASASRMPGKASITSTLRMMTVSI